MVTTAALYNTFTNPYGGYVSYFQPPKLSQYGKRASQIEQLLLESSSEMDK